MPVYCGIGGRVGFYDGDGKHDDRTRAGVRVPLGVTYILADAPLDVFVEVVPMLDVAPRTALRWDAAAGVRFYLH